MGKKWDGVVIENCRNEEFDGMAFEKLVEEVAGILYSDICQLQKIQNLDSFNVKINFLQRTGTDA